MSTEIQNNFVYLSEKITNIQSVLVHLIEKGIISNDEMERIMSGTTTMDRNVMLLNTLQSKDWHSVKQIFVEILKKTYNQHCAEKIEQSDPVDIYVPCKKLKGPLDTKWWPEEKQMIKSFQERSTNNQLLIAELESMILSSKDGMAVISQKVTVSGLGGVGKTTAAKWFANHYSDNYEYILWIDCGEGRLLKSFQKLARDLTIPSRSEFELSELAQKCFSQLRSFKCLWIFDNAECYVGQQGIREVLPKQDNFHTIITSRNSEWGNENGDGKIASFQLETFTTQESLAFLLKNIKNVNQETDIELLEHLSSVLGNLPLALQIAVATLNRNKISLTEYIKRIRQTDDIIHSSFDDYENTINRTMKISLDVIKKHEGLSGNLAHQILITFAYIKPDFVDVDFISNVESKTNIEVAAAGDLLVKYSLITRSDYAAKTQSYFHVHRLLQQVIRCNTRNDQECERATLAKILKCDGYLDYKLIPYTFADEFVQNQFPEIKAELIDQLKLEEMTKERRFQEAVDLALIIHNAVSSSSSLYNYATCLERNGEREESIVIFEKMFVEVEQGGITSYDVNAHGIMDLKRKPTKGLIAGQLFMNYWKLKELEKAKQIFEKQKQLIFKTSVQNFHDLTYSFASVPSHSYFLNFDGRQEFFYCDEFPCKRADMYEKRWQMVYCKIFANIKFPNDLKFLSMSQVTAVKPNGDIIERLDLSDAFSSELKYLYSSTLYKSKTLAFSTNIFTFLDSLELHAGNEIILMGNLPFAPRTLKLVNCTFVRDGEKVEKVLVNDFVDFQNIVCLELRTKKAVTMIIDMKEPLQIDSVVLEGKIEILKWDVAQWEIKTYEVLGIPFVKTSQLNFKELELTDCPSLDLSVIPPYLERLALESPRQVNCTQTTNILNLKYLQLRDTDLNFLPHFSNCHNLSHLLLESENTPMKLRFSQLPKTVKKLKLTKFINEITIIADSKTILDTFILQGYTWEEFEYLVSNLSQLNAAHVILECRRELTGDSMERIMGVLLKLKIQTCCETVGIGEWKWAPGEFQLFNCLKFVDKEAENYVFENLKGIAIDKFEFKKMVSFNYHTVKWDFTLLKSEKERLSTFSGWKLSLFTPKECAKAGFFYTQKMDEIECVFCEKQKSIFEPHHSLDNHSSHFEYCPLLLGLSCGNIPIMQSAE